MSIDLWRAAERLIAAYMAGAAEEGEQFTHRVKLGDILTLENIETVARLDLFANFDLYRFGEKIEEQERRERMLKAWLEATKPGRVQ